MSVTDSPVPTSSDVVGHAQIPNWLLREATVSLHAKMLYAYLSSRTGREGVAWPGQGLIATETGMSESTVKRALTQLRALGLVTVEVVATPTGRRNRYLLHTSQGASPHSEGMGGSGQRDLMGEVSVTSEEEPVEEEPSVPTTLPSRPQVVDARRGRMTDSWNPTALIPATAQDAYPRVNVKREVTTFRAWHQSKAAVERSQSEWDNLFVTWCGRKQEQWDQANPPADLGVRYDDVTGMPVNPKQAGTPAENRE